MCIIPRKKSLPMLLKINKILYFKVTINIFVGYQKELND